MKKVLLSTIFMSNFMCAQNTTLLIPQKHPFSYNLGVKVIPSEKRTQEITICCHGYGHCNEIVDIVRSRNMLPGYLIGFNFPDYGIVGNADHSASAFGSIDELLPLLYLLKHYVCDENFGTVNLYGFSAGGGAIINALVVLNQGLYKDELAGVGISEDNVKQILCALEDGSIILDCPLKSMAEIISFRGNSRELQIVEENYSRNNMNPIDVLPQLSGLGLNIFLYFEKPDDVLSNRDDALFVERLRKANGGTTHVASGSTGGHSAYHARLWNCYQNNHSGA